MLLVTWYVSMIVSRNVSRNVWNIRNNIRILTIEENVTSKRIAVLVHKMNILRKHNASSYLQINGIY